MSGVAEADRGAAVRHIEGPPESYVDEVALYVRRLALAGRGEDVRGRNLMGLQVLEAGYANGWLSYTPNRDVARWLLMLLDLVGARRGLGPRARVQQPLEGFLAEVEGAGLHHVAQVTRDVTLGRLARVLAWPLAAAAAFGSRLAVASVLWHLGFRSGDYRGQVHFEKNSQGKLVRRKITATLDRPWAAALRTLAKAERPNALHVLAALPPDLEVVIAQMEGALDRVEEPLEGVPFAVFYSLATDASRSGRRWDPPERYVHGAAYTREDFERAIGRFSKGARSRKGRYRRSASLAELGLSSIFPETVSVIDGWLASCRCSELWVEPAEGGRPGSDDGWLDVARGRQGAIRDVRDRIHAAVSSALRQPG